MRLSESTTHAAAILDAWRENNLEQLRQNLVSAASLDSDDSSTADECERRELLEGIAAELRGIVASGETQQIAAFLPLLTHLAHPVESKARRAFVC